MKKKPLFVVWITITRCRQCVRCNYLLYLIDVAVQLVYSLITSLLIILLARPEVLDRFHCTEDVAPVKPAGGHNTTAVFEKQHHVIVLSLKSLDKGLFVCSSCVCLSVLALQLRDIARSALLYWGICCSMCFMRHTDQNMQNYVV